MLSDILLHHVISLHWLYALDLEAGNQTRDNQQCQVRTLSSGAHMGHDQPPAIGRTIVRDNASKATLDLAKGSYLGKLHSMEEATSPNRILKYLFLLNLANHKTPYNRHLPFSFYEVDIRGRRKEGVRTCMATSDCLSFCIKWVMYITLFYHQSHEADNFLSSLRFDKKKKKATRFETNCTKSRRQWQSQNQTQVVKRHSS